MVDDRLLERFLEDENLITVDEVIAALRKGTFESKLLVVLCGAALRNKGVQYMLDCVGHFLPSPLDMPPVQGKDDRGQPATRDCDADQPFSALAFKTVFDPNGDLTFLRIYSRRRGRRMVSNMRALARAHRPAGACTRRRARPIGAEAATSSRRVGS